jgi:hypothetical protein
VALTGVLPLRPRRDCPNQQKIDASTSEYDVFSSRFHGPGRIVFKFLMFILRLFGKYDARGVALSGIAGVSAGRFRIPRPKARRINRRRTV